MLCPFFAGLAGAGARGGDVGLAAPPVRRRLLRHGGWGVAHDRAGVHAGGLPQVRNAAAQSQNGTTLLLHNSTTLRLAQAESRLGA